MKGIKLTLYNKIKESPLAYGAMCELVAEEGFKVETGSRKLRNLVEEKLIENIYKTSKKGKPYICGYKLPENPTVTFYAPVYQIVNDQNGRPVVKKL